MTQLLTKATQRGWIAFAQPEEFRSASAIIQGAIERGLIKAPQPIRPKSRSTRTEAERREHLRTYHRNYMRRKRGGSI